MKQITLFLLLILSIQNCFSQNNEVTSETAPIPYNKWTFEFSVGQSKGVRPYLDYGPEAGKYYSSSPGKFFGGLQPNAFKFGARYMIGPKFGFKGTFSYESIKNNNKNGSKPFEMQMIGFTAEGVVNANRLFNIEDYLNRWGILLHAGIKVDRMTSKTANFIENDHNYGICEYNGGLFLGATGQYRFSKKMSVFLDVSSMNSYRQHFNWDGSYSENANNLNGQLVTTSFGLTYSLGKDKIHGDWAIIPEKGSDRMEALDKRIGDLETMMDDSDKDGVPDYLDTENNSIAGVAVDTKGRMVDINRNGVPDELEKFVNNSIVTNNTAAAGNNEVLAKFINEGYVAAYFDTANPQPTNASSDNIGFILNYLRSNPTKSIDIIGYADVIGNSNANNSLSSKRAENIKTILIKSGIDASRLVIKANGVDDSVDKNSEYARRLVRKVVFKITN